MCRMQMLADLLICTTASCEMLRYGILECRNFKIFPRQGYPGTLLQACTLRIPESIPVNPNHLQILYNQLQENVLRSRSIVVDAKPNTF